MRDYYTELCSKCKYKDVNEQDSPCKECFAAFFDDWRNPKRKFGKYFVEDKDYEKAVNAFLKGEELSLDCKIEEESAEKLREMCTIPDDIKEKLVDIYNYMAINRNSRIELMFDIGIKFICEIDDSEWKSLPRVNLDDVLKGEN